MKLFASHNNPHHPWQPRFSRFTKELRCAHAHTQKLTSPLTTEHSLHGVNEMNTRNTQQTVTSTLPWQSPPITSAFVIASQELPSVGFELRWSLPLAVLFSYPRPHGQKEKKTLCQWYTLKRVRSRTYVSICLLLAPHLFRAQMGQFQVPADTGRWLTLRRLILFTKRVRVIQNTDDVIMLLVSVCQYDLDCRRLLSGIIACATFRRLCNLVPPSDSSISGQPMQ